MALTVMQLLPALEVGGVERGTLEIAAALIERGHQAIVVSAGGHLVDELCALGATHVNCPIGRKSVRTLLTIKRLRDIIKRYEVDLVHARSRLPAWIGHHAISGLAQSERPRWITTVHGPYSVNFYSRIMTSGDQVIAISEFIRDYVLTNYPSVSPSRIKVIARGVDRNRYAHAYQPSQFWQTKWQEQHPQLDGKRLLVLPGRITRWKGQADFITMLDELVQREFPVHGLIAGGASDSGSEFERDLREQVAARGLLEHLTFLGQRADLRDILAHADIAYSLTLEPEAFGRTTIEALSVGTPVIGYAHGGTGEILREVLPQGLVAPGNVTHAVETTCAFLAKPAPVPATHKYTLAAMQQATIDVYENVLRSPGA
jgi:glycosyltransferase involved in cell wall biosynthesis